MSGGKGREQFREGEGGGETSKVEYCWKVSCGYVSLSTCLES